MYNGIGLSSVRGTATSGHVQANRGYVHADRRRQVVERHQGKRDDSRDSKVVSAAVQQQGNRDIQLHHRKRLIENDLLVLREDLENRNTPSDEIERIVSNARQEKLKFLEGEQQEGGQNDPKSVNSGQREAQSGLGESITGETDRFDHFTSRQRSDRTCFNCGQPGHFARECPEPRQVRSRNQQRDGGRSTTNTHVRALKKQEQNSKLADAFGISRDRHVEGKAFDQVAHREEKRRSELEEEKRQAKLAKVERKKQRDLIRETRKDKKRDQRGRSKTRSKRRSSTSSSSDTRSSSSYSRSSYSGSSTSGSSSSSRSSRSSSTSSDSRSFSSSSSSSSSDSYRDRQRRKRSHGRQKSRRDSHYSSSGSRSSPPRKRRERSWSRSPSPEKSRSRLQQSESRHSKRVNDRSRSRSASPKEERTQPKLHNESRKDGRVEHGESRSPSAIDPTLARSPPQPSRAERRSHSRSPSPEQQVRIDSFGRIERGQHDKRTRHQDVAEFSRSSSRGVSSNEGQQRESSEHKRGADSSPQLNRTLPSGNEENNHEKDPYVCGSPIGAAVSSSRKDRKHNRRARSRSVSSSSSGSSGSISKSPDDSRRGRNRRRRGRSCSQSPPPREKSKKGKIDSSSGDEPRGSQGETNK